MGTWARNSTGKYIKIGPEADDLPVTPPSGKKTIDSTSEVDVAAYATAQVSDENLTAENIKKDVEVLGITGSYEGGGGGESITWLLEDVTETVVMGEDQDIHAVFPLPESITAENLVSTFSGKNVVCIYEGVRVEMPCTAGDGGVSCGYWNDTDNNLGELLATTRYLEFAVSYWSESDIGQTKTLSVGIVND